MNIPKTMTALARLTASILLFSFSLALALEPPTKEQIERYKKNGTLAARIAQAKSYGNYKIAPRLVARMRQKLQRPAIIAGAKLPAQDTRDRIAAPPSGWAGLPTTGTVKVLALLIAFNDYPPVTSAQNMAAALFGDGQGGFPYESLRNYYRRSSYNQLEIQGNVLGWYTAPYARSTVAETDAGREALIKEALTYYNQQGHDFTQYDNNGDGAIDYFCVFWTGPHGEWASFWWGYETGFYDSSYRLDGKRLSNYSWQWELPDYPNGTFSPTTIIHETGHALGVPDYYDYDASIGPRGGVGGLDMMDAAVGDHNCFTKYMLDWISPTVVALGPQGVQLRASGLFGDAILFMTNAVSGDIFDEYFMVQNRYRSGNDTGLFTGADGLLIWHVDAHLDPSGYTFLYDNSYTAHKLLKLMEADGKNLIETSAAPAHAGDYYQAGMTFGPTTNPDSSRYDGYPTGMGVWDIVGTTTPMSLQVFSADAPPAASILNLASGQTVFDTIQVDVSASDDTGISKVELYIDGLLMGTDTAAPYSFALDTRGVMNGTHTIRAIAYDTIMQAASSSVPVFIDNLYAPSSMKVERVVNRGVILREYINVLSWMDNPSNTSSVTKYRIYLLGGTGRELLAEVPKKAALSAYTYLHRHVSGTQSYTYNIVTVGSLNREGDAAAATIR